MEVSPDRSLLAYVEHAPNDEETLWVVRANGEVVNTIPWGAEWGGFRWANNELMEYFYGYWHRIPLPEGKTLGTVGFVNVFTGEVRELLSAFPDPYYDPSSPPWWLARYSPDLKQVIYLQDQYQSFPIVILWDLTAQRALGQSPSGETLLGIEPEWSPAGDQVAAIADGSLYRVDRTGKELPLPDLGNSPWTEVTGFALSWSPDGRYLAFWMAIDEGYTARLLLLDTWRERIIDYCLESDYHDSLPLWSPDGQQFFLFDINDGQGGGLHVLVKRGEEVAYPIPWSQKPIEWMKSVP